MSLAWEGTPRVETDPLAYIVRTTAPEKIEVQKIGETEYHLVGEQSQQFYFQAATFGAAMRTRTRIYNTWR